MDVSKEQVLVVDDEDELRRAIVEILTLDSFEVEQSSQCRGSGREAFADGLRRSNHRSQPSR